MEVLYRLNPADSGGNATMHWFEGNVLENNANHFIVKFEAEEYPTVVTAPMYDAELGEWIYKWKYLYNDVVIKLEKQPNTTTNENSECVFTTVERQHEMNKLMNELIQAKRNSINNKLSSRLQKFEKLFREVLSMYKKNNAAF